MDVGIIATNYALALTSPGKSHSERVYFLCALKGFFASLTGAYLCRKRPRMSSVKTEAKKLLLFVLLFETVFYWGHRLLHLPRFYNLHKLHHAATNPEMRDGLVASLPEIILTGSLPFFGAVWLTKMSRTVYLLMLASGLPFALLVHSNILGDRHLNHHRDTSCNFGNTRIWDVICFTGK